MKTKNLVLMALLLTATLLTCGCMDIEKPSEFYPMPFGAQITFSSGDMFIDIDELKEQLQVIEETGADVIRIDIDYEAWMTNAVDNIDRHNQLIAQIREDDEKLMLADRGAASFTQNKVTWEYFKQQHLKHTRIFMEAYEPDYYVVVKEPTWYIDIDPMISTNTTPMMWYELALEACDIVKEINPETKTAVAVYPSGRLAEGFFELAANIHNLDIMGVDCYDTNDLQITTDDLIPLVPDDKEIWMLESWNGGGSSYLQPWKKYADAKWIQGSVYYSQNNNFSGYICYYPIHFSSYMKLKDIDWGQRTPAFYAYKDVIEEVNGASTVAKFQSGFEEVDSFTFPENWQNLSRWGKWEWHLETDYAHAEIIEVEGKGHVAKVIHNPNTPRSIIMACTADSNILQKGKRYLTYEFLVPENALDNNKGIFIDIEQWEPWQKKGDVVGLLGFTPIGWVAAFTGYHPDPNEATPVTIGRDAFTLQPNDWYTVRLEVDFVKEKFIFFSIYGPDVNKSWDLDISFGYHDNPLPDEWVAVAIYIGVRELTEQEGMYALFDNVEFGVII